METKTCAVVKNNSREGVDRENTPCMPVSHRHFLYPAKEAPALIIRPFNISKRTERTRRRLRNGQEERSVTLVDTTKMPGSPPSADCQPFTGRVACCSTLLFRRKKLLLTMTALVVLALTSQTGTMITHTAIVTHTATVCWGSCPLGCGSSCPGQRPAKSGRPPGSPRSQHHEAPVSNGKALNVDNAVRSSLNVDNPAGAKGNSESQDTRKGPPPQTSEQAGKDPAVASHGQNGVRVNAEHLYDDSQTMNIGRSKARAEDAREIRGRVMEVESVHESPKGTGGNTASHVLQLKDEVVKHRDLPARLLTDADQRDDKATNNTNEEIRHVFFLKVHKAASTTVMNVLYRFAVSRHLNVMLPRRGSSLSQTSPRWTQAVMPLPRHAAHFDILCNHLVFSEPPIRHSLGKHARFIGIVREPFQQFLSAFHYYRNVHRTGYLKRIPGKDPVASYLQNPGKYEPKDMAKSFTHNRMSFDFGMNPIRMSDKRYINTYITYLERTFDLVMIKERFDESMLLMKRLLGWRLEDVLYVKNNVFTTPYLNFTYSSYQKHVHRMFNAADYRLYENFKALFQSKVDNEGELFKKEVAAFVSLREQVEDFCRKPGAESISLAAIDRTPVLQVVRTDCLMMTLPEIDFVREIRSWQYGTRRGVFKL
ncbi:uncharacterized protein LOC143278055 [Babylonia areolata]|uniref:uncharacterized protein LOC143278055 n=1 Tax=Babylonia areolata TaxID=304850 RepID=UPI003FD0731F